MEILWSTIWKCAGAAADKSMRCNWPCRNKITQRTRAHPDRSMSSKKFCDRHFKMCGLSETLCASGSTHYAMFVGDWLKMFQYEFWRASLYFVNNIFEPAWCAIIMHNTIRNPNVIDYHTMMFRFYKTNCYIHKCKTKKHKLKTNVTEMKYEMQLHESHGFVCGLLNFVLWKLGFHKISVDYC